MMTTKDTTRFKRNSRSNSDEGSLLNEIESLSKDLYLDKNLSKTSSSSSSRSQPLFVDKSRSKHSSESTKDKKSFWNWKPLKALTHVGHQRFNCCFSLDVHTIEGLPLKFHDSIVRVHWKRKDGELVTNPIKVIGGVAEFEEKLTYTCSIYGSRSGPHHSAKYEAKHFLLYAEELGKSSLNLGKHSVDLTRFLPVRLEELEDENSSGTWTTTFKLSGEAKGAILNVSFGYLVLGDGIAPIAPNNKNVPQLLDPKASTRNYTPKKQGDGKISMRRAGSLPATLKPSSISPLDDVKVLHEVPPTRNSDFSNFVSMESQKFDRGRLDSLKNGKHVKSASQSSMLYPFRDNYVNEENLGFSFIEEGIEKEQSRSIDDRSILRSDCRYGDVGVSGQQEVDFERAEFPLDLMANDKNSELSVTEKSTSVNDGGKVPGDHEIVRSDFPSMHNDEGTSYQEEGEIVIHDCTKESLLKKLESGLSNVAELENDPLDSPVTIPDTNREEIMETGQAENVGDKFNLNFEGDPESPRERLLREFEKEVEENGFSLFGFGIDKEIVKENDGYSAPTISRWEDVLDDSDCLTTENSKYPKITAKVIEDFETQELLQEFDLDDNYFMNSPPSRRACFIGSIDRSPKEPLELPPLGEGLGSFIQTKSEGFLRSMNPDLFKEGKSGGTLIMQISSPVVVPAELGNGVMDIVQHLGSMGIEKLSIQANKLMPLEDISGRTMQQIALEVASQLEDLESKNLQDKLDDCHVISARNKQVKEGYSGQKSNKTALEYVDSEFFASLEDLVPLAIDKVEALSIEGLRIQCGMSNEEAPLNINAHTIGEFSTLEGKNVTSIGSIGLEGALGLKLLALEDTETHVNEGLMGLSLTIDEWMKLDSCEINEGEFLSERILKLLAAHHAKTTNPIFVKKGSRVECGFLGNNLTISMMVQLRDPLRNYDPVGTPMLALIQVERSFVPSKHIDYNNHEDDLDPKVKHEEECLISQYKITEVHISGFKTRPNKSLWGCDTGKQSGSHWLLANGMGKVNKTPFLKPGIVVKSSFPTIASDILWSVSARVDGSGAQLNELGPHIRNPNVIISNEGIKFQ